MKAKHTPGPWIAIKADVHNESNDRWSVCTGGPRQFFIATIENGAPGDIVATEAVNAHLIAAAPDMLEALLHADEACAPIVGPDEWPRTEIRAAIAKAQAVSA